MKIGRAVAMMHHKDTGIQQRRPIDDHAKVIVIGGRRGSLDRKVNHPRQPTAYLKFPTSFAEPGADLLLPRRDGRFEIEAAVGFVIGRTAARVLPTDVPGAITGFILLADVTDVDAYEEEARTNNGLLAKNHPGFSAAASGIHPADGSPLPSFDVRLSVNGVLRQGFSTSDLLWSVEEAVAAWSVPTLVPGDIIALGAAIARTPIPPVTITAGDKIEISCAKLGTIRHTVAVA